MDIIVVINQMFILLLLMGLGYLLVKIKFVDDVFNKQLSKLIINVSMPALILASVSSSKPEGDTSSVLLMLGIALLSFLVTPLFAWVVTRGQWITKENKNIFIYMLTFSNVAFMGFPVMESIFGLESIFYTAILNLAFNLFNFSLGISLMSGQGLASFNPKKLINPGIIASILAMIIYFASISLPIPLVKTFTMLGSTTSPLAMLVIGMSLAKIPLKSVFTDWKLYPYAIIKLVLFPIIGYFILKPFISNPIVIGVMVIALAMPTATSAVLFANEFNKDTTKITQFISLTTLLSMLSIPLVAFLFFI